MDLSGNLLRVVEGVYGGPIRCGSGATPPGSLVAGRITDAGAVAAALHQTLARAEIRETKALLAISDAAATFRILRFSSSTTDQAVESAVAKEFPMDPERMETKWVDVDRKGDLRTVYATAWDRSLVSTAMSVAHDAGLDPIAVELKSTSVARTVSDSSCVVLDMSCNPAEIFLIDEHLPQLWHSFELTVQLGEDITGALIGPLRQVIRFFERRRDTTFSSNSPILIAGDQVLPGQLLAYLTQALGHPVRQLPPPARIPQEVRHGTYLTCLGILMRRES